MAWCVTLCIPILCTYQTIKQILRTICAGGGATELGHGTGKVRSVRVKVEGFVLKVMFVLRYDSERLITMQMCVVYSHQSLSRVNCMIQVDTSTCKLKSIAS